jgi:hypothetical protein
MLYLVPLPSLNYSFCITYSKPNNETVEVTDNGGYPDFVHYNQPPAVPLLEEEQTWLAENVQKL